MSTEESDQVVQRRANLEALKELGVDPYPKRFEGATPITQLLSEHGEKTSEQLQAPQITTRVAGRILAIRTFGKAGFLQLSDGRSGQLDDITTTAQHSFLVYEIQTVGVRG